MDWESRNREKLTTLYSKINQQVPTYLGANILGTQGGHSLVQIKKSVVCLKRFKTLVTQSSYLVTE
jgi:hypothetical protein